MTQSQAMIAEAFQSASYVADRMDVQHTPLYDTVTIAAAGAVNPLTTAFFTNVGAASGKTLAQTNMTQSQRLPAPEAFSIFGFRLRWAEDILLADLYTLLNGFCLEFIIGQKVYQRAPLWHFNAGGGINAFTTANNTTILGNGLPTREAMHKLAIPIVIENQTTFFAQRQGNGVNLTAGGAGGTGATLVLLLDGFYARGVQ